MATEGLQKAFSIASGVLANVKPDQLDAPTPCASWDVRALINHLVGGAHWFGLSMEAGESPATGEDTDFASIDYVASYDEGAKRSVAAFSAPGALEKTVTLPFGAFPGAAFLGLATTDTFVHAWDLARATGQATDLDPALATELLAGAKASIPAQFRGDDGVMPFGAEQQAPTNARPADQLAAFLGRTI